MRPSNKPVETGFRVRLMSPLGNYPAHSVVGESSALVVTPEVCFSIVRVKERDCSFSEVDNLTPAEIPLLGSILLSGDKGDSYIYPYPTDSVLLLESDSTQGINEGSISESRLSLIDHLSQGQPGSTPAHNVHMPPALGGASYQLVPSRHLDKERLIMLRRLETADPVLLRGIACLLKAHMAFKHRELAEAACIFLWISLDAAHSVILGRLRAGGAVNPTSQDAARYFENVSGYQTEWENFFEDDYMNRIRVIHPDNRFGVEARPQLLADDFLELNDILIPLFQFLAMEPTAATSPTERP